MPLEAVPFAPAHLASFRPGVRERVAMSGARMLDPTRWIGAAVTLRDEGATLGIVGAFRRGDGWHLSVLLSDALRRRPLALHRLARRLLRRVAAGNGDLVLHAWAAEEDLAAQAWLARLGFRRGECGCEPFGPAAVRYVFSADDRQPIPTTVPGRPSRHGEMS